MLCSILGNSKVAKVKANVKTTAKEINSGYFRLICPFVCSVLVPTPILFIYLLVRLTIKGFSRNLGLKVKCHTQFMKKTAFIVRKRVSHMFADVYWSLLFSI
jgi:hypothetical protein